MLTSRLRALVLGLLAVMLAGSVMAGAASAEAGPFWHHREIGGTGKGEKIEPKAPESFEGKGGKQVLTSEPGGTKIELTSPATQVKGALVNGPHQGQIKLVIFYQQPELKINNEVAKECKASIGQQGQFSDIVQLKGHLAWKWDGTKEQLEEEPQKVQKWDIIFTQIEPQRQSEKEFPLFDLRTGVGVFAEIDLVGNGCPGLLKGPQRVGGSEVGIPSLPELGEFSKTLGVRTIPSGTLPKEVVGNKVEGLGFLQQVWVGLPTGKKESQPLILGLTFAGQQANLVGQTETTAAQQEIAVFEK